MIMWRNIQLFDENSQSLTQHESHLLENQLAFLFCIYHQPNHLPTPPSVSLSTYSFIRLHFQGYWKEDIKMLTAIMHLNTQNMAFFLDLLMNFLKLLHCRCSQIARKKEMFYLTLQRVSQHTSVISLIDGEANLNQQHSELQTVCLEMQLCYF